MRHWLYWSIWMKVRSFWRYKIVNRPLTFDDYFVGLFDKP